MEGQEEEDHVEEEEEDEEEEADRLRTLKGVCQEYCAQLILFGQTVRNAQLVIRNLLRLYPFSQTVSNIYEHSAARLVGLGIYITSCLADDPRSPKEYVWFKTSTVIASKDVMALAVTLSDVLIAPFTTEGTNLSMTVSESLWK